MKKINLLEEQALPHVGNCFLNYSLVVVPGLQWVAAHLQRRQKSSLTGAIAKKTASHTLNFQVFVENVSIKNISGVVAGIKQSLITFWCPFYIDYLKESKEFLFVTALLCTFFNIQIGWVGGVREAGNE